MIINIHFIPERNESKSVEVADDALCLDVLDKLNLSPDAHIVIREGNPIPIDEKLKDGERIEIIKVVSGG